MSNPAHLMMTTHATEPRLLASDGCGVPRGAGQKADKSGPDNRTGGMVNPGTVARRIDAVRTRLVQGARRPSEQESFRDAGITRGVAPEVVILHADAEDLVNEWMPRLGDRARVLLDPPYSGATGYPAQCPRDKVLRIAETCARHGGKVMLCEAQGLAAELGTGWHQLELAPGARKQEWLTTFGVCHDLARYGRLFEGNSS